MNREPSPTQSRIRRAQAAGRRTLRRLSHRSRAFSLLAGLLAVLVPSAPALCQLTGMSPDATAPAPCHADASAGTTGEPQPREAGSTCCASCEAYLVSSVDPSDVDDPPGTDSPRTRSPMAHFAPTPAVLARLEARRARHRLALPERLRSRAPTTIPLRA